MLIEVKKENLKNGSFRLFMDEFFDLTVFFGASNEITAFQLSYKKPSDEHSLEWQKDSGFLHSRVDDGESSPLHNDSPILLKDGPFPHKDISRRFIESSKDIDSKVAAFIGKKILEAGKKLPTKRRKKSRRT
ncbi:MAG: hypothetical protein OEV59_03525 [Deltaproteobacteria bacterium]|nr:hypothetical protein [Deltaproteobacteria bacterium]